MAESDSPHGGRKGGGGGGKVIELSVWMGWGSLMSLDLT